MCCSMMATSYGCDPCPAQMPSPPLVSLSCLPPFLPSPSIHPSVQVPPPMHPSLQLLLTLGACPPKLMMLSRLKPLEMHEGPPVELAVHASHPPHLLSHQPILRVLRWGAATTDIPLVMLPLDWQDVTGQLVWSRVNPAANRHPPCMKQSLTRYQLKTLPKQLLADAGATLQS